jgi:predicted nucleic acid-binding protein
LALILADTDVLIDYLAGVQPVTAEVAGYATNEQLQTTAITCFELLSGAGEGKKGEAIRKLVSALKVLPLDRDAAERAAGVRRELERSGRAIGMGDSLIAGIALSHNLPLFTRNRKHFERVPNLKLVEMEGQA